MGRALTWPLAAPLMTLGLLAAHGLAYVLVVPEPGRRAQELASSGHGYLELAPAVVAACVALGLIALALRAAHATRGGLGPEVAPWPFGLLPALGFALQEHLERALSGGHWPLAAALEPTFLVGLALQLPFGAVAYLLARALARGADRLGGALREAGVPRPGPRALSASAPAVDVTRLPAPARARATRGPPLSRRR